MKNANGNMNNLFVLSKKTPRYEFVCQCEATKALNVQYFVREAAYACLFFFPLLIQ